MKDYSNPIILRESIQLIWHDLDNLQEKITCVAGRGEFGIPIAKALAEEYELKLSILNRKNKGRLFQIYTPTRGDFLLIIDDIESEIGYFYQQSILEKGIKIIGKITIT